MLLENKYSSVTGNYLVRMFGCVGGVVTGRFNSGKMTPPMEYSML